VIKYCTPTEISGVMYKNICDIPFIVQQTIPLHILPMDTFSDEEEGTSIQNHSDTTSVTSFHSPQAGLSEPEDSMSSASEYFDEEDMYPADYGDESVSNNSESASESHSPSGELVCTLL
jgi:hypothetical protein